jgi:triacylglycerol esterase/lipase EstA (alpha/beta hydrolase family)
MAGEMFTLYDDGYCFLDWPYWYILEEGATEWVYINSVDSIYEGIWDYGPFSYFTQEVGTHTIASCCWSDGWDDHDEMTLTVTAKTNDYPVVLIGGFTMWGRHELNLQFNSVYSASLYYWGMGSGDLEDEMNDRGFEVYTASVGPVTSIWDRACELYAQLTGTNVDYGSYHSSMFTKTDGTYTYSHTQHGNDHPSAGTELLVNTAGQTIDAMSSDNPVHLIGHSLGGVTARMLAYLMNQGSPNCTQAVGSKTCEGDSDLFTGGNTGNVRSVMTLSSPHNGTNIVQKFASLLAPKDKFSNKLLEGIFNLSADSAENSIINIYDADCDQWTPTHAAFSTLVDFDPTNCSMPINPDALGWDASPCGATELNKFMTAQSDVYYLSYATEQTFKCDDSSGCLSGDTVKQGEWAYEDAASTLYRDCDKHCDGGGYSDEFTSTTYGDRSHAHDGQMCPIFRLFSDDMGSTAWTAAFDQSTESGLQPLGTEWRENDGVVNTEETKKPDCDSFVDGVTSSTPSLDITKAQTGKWLYMDKLHDDHFDVTGGIAEIQFYQKMWGENVGMYYNNTYEPVEFMDWFQQYVLVPLHKLPSF